MSLPKELIGIPVGVLTYGDGTFGVETYADPYVAGSHTQIAIFETREAAETYVRIHPQRLL